MVVVEECEKGGRVKKESLAGEQGLYNIVVEGRLTVVWESKGKTCCALTLVWESKGKTRRKCKASCEKL